MKEKARGKISSILLFWFMTFLVVIGLVALTLKMMGMPVGQTFLSLGNSIPGINHLLPEVTGVHVQAEGNDESEDWQAKYEQLETQLLEKDQTIASLNEQLTASEKDVQALKKDVFELNKQYEEQQSEEIEKQMKQLAKVYENMSASKAAALIEQMPIEEATLTLMQLDTKQQGKILGGIKNKKKAADITLLMKDAALLPNTGQMTLEEKINMLTSEDPNPVEVISDTISKMPTAQSAKILETMMGTDANVAMDIFRDLDSDTRSQILAVIAQENENLATQITADLKE